MLQDSFSPFAMPYTFGEMLTFEFWGYVHFTSFLSDYAVVFAIGFCFFFTVHLLDYGIILVLFLFKMLMERMRGPTCSNRDL